MVAGTNKADRENPGRTISEGIAGSVRLVGGRMEKLAFLLESDGFEETGSPERFEGTGSANSQSFDLRSVETLERSVQRLENLLQTVKHHS